MKIKHTIFPILATLMMGSAHAAVSFSDNPQGATITEFYDDLTRVVAGSSPAGPSSGALGRNRLGLDAGETVGQTFTVNATIILDSIYLGYNDQQSTGTFNFNLDIGNTGTADHTFLITLASVGQLQTGGGNGGPFHFMQFGLASEGISLDAGLHSFNIEALVDNGEGGFLFAPTFTNNAYAGGAQTIEGSPNASRDFIFAVTAVPEPSSSLLALIGSAALLLRRRRA